METQDLIKTVERLRDELSHVHRLDHETAKKLQSALTDIQNAIAQSDSLPNGEQSQPNSFSTRLQELIDEFESNHPHLSSTLSLIADRLADMGI